MQKIIDLLVKFLPQNYKTYGAAFVAALLAFDASLKAVGVVFLPDQAVTILIFLASALGLVGLRHAISKAESRGVNFPHFGLFLALGLTFAATGCTVGVNVKHDYPPEPCKGCKCSADCKCGLKCDCKPGKKCSISCDCGRLKGFELSELPTAPPDMYLVANDGERNGWWKIAQWGEPKGDWYGWWHDGRVIGLYSPHGTWRDPHAHVTGAPPWLAGCKFGLQPDKLSKTGERLLISGK
jgi:hypothetical protein